MTWALGYWVAMPTEFFIIPFSNEHGISDSGGFSSEDSYGGEDVVTLPLFSSPGL